MFTLSPLDLIIVVGSLLLPVAVGLWAARHKANKMNTGPLKMCISGVIVLTTFGMALAARAEPAADKSGVRQPADYAAAEKRLTELYSFDRVAKERIEVRWDDLLGMATPLAQRVPIQACHHPEVVYVHPDLSLSIGRENGGVFGIGVAVGNPPQLPDMWQVSRRLRKDYLPIVESQWRVGAVAVTQTAFAMLARDAAVVTGKETQYVVVRLSISNTATTACATALHLLIGNSACDGGYGPFLTPIGRWQTDRNRGIIQQGAALIQNGRVLLTYRCSAQTAAGFVPFVEGVTTAGHPDALTNVLRFDLQLKPGETRAVDLVIAGTSKLHDPSEQAAMEKVDFDTALQRAVTDWEAKLAPAMEYVTPEPRLNSLYKQLILSCVQNTLQNPERPWREPVQTPAFYFGVWPWEFAHMAVPLMGLGYARDLQPALRYLTERQNGVGAHSANQMANGDVKSMKGSFGGTIIAWMGDTGGGLWALAEEYRYSRDAEWLKANQGSILAACDWIQAARAQTRITNEQGKKVPYYGLLPSGQSSDEDGKAYLFTFTDNLTWYAMSELATAFRQAGLPAADRLTREADEYRQCILEVIRQEQHVDPETKLLVIPHTVSGKGRKIEVGWTGNGPIQLFDTGLLVPTDERFAPMLEYTARKFGVLIGLTEHYAGGGQWYPNQTERAYYKCFLARGEIEKSLLVFYSNLAYGRDNSTYQTMERVLVGYPNCSPFSPNMSGNGRQLDMMRRMLIDEQDEAQGTLWLLRGCPRRWFTPNQSVKVSNAPTLFGQMALRTACTSDTITIDIDPPANPALKRLCVAVRHPARQTPRDIKVNGASIAIAGEIVTVPAPTGRVSIVARYN